MTAVNHRAAPIQERSTMNTRSQDAQETGQQRWLAAGFIHPAFVALHSGAHLRPIRADDVDIDYPAVMGSRERLWARYGPVWGWPPATMTVEEDREDLARHEREIAAHESFNYAILDESESPLLGCIYLDPPRTGDDGDGDVIVSWWVIDGCVDTALAHELDRFVPHWVTTAWPFQRPRVHP
jgi:hypothetical protein